MVDFEVLHAVLFNPKNLIAAPLFLVSSVALCTARWLLLARPQGISASFSRLFSLSMIGQFFNTFMPGSVGGDLVKAWYIAGQEPERRTRAVFSVLIDRVLGLAVIIFYAAFTVLFYTQWLEGNAHLKFVTTVIWAFTSASILFGFLFFSPALWKTSLFIRFLEFLHRNEKLGKIIDAGVLYRHHFVPVFWATILSALSILSMNLFIWFIGTSMDIPLDLPHYFFIVPLALTFSAIPLLPGGIGTGQVAFFTLFQWVGVPDPQQGSTLCTVYQIYTILFSFLGALFYLKFKKGPQTQGVSRRTAAPPGAVSSAAV